MRRKKTVNWEKYASAYDLMAHNNPSYQDILAIMSQQSAGWSIKAGDMIADLGAGTGNYSTLLASLFPSATVVHVDSSQEMNERASQKACFLSCKNLQVRTEAVDMVNFLPESLAAVVCVHALYTFPNYRHLISKMHRWLRPGGVLFVCDLGRPMDVNDWSRYIFREAYRQDGLLATLRLFWKGRVVANQNRKIRALQESGDYPMHELAEFRKRFERCGFRTILSEECYRGYSDLIIAVKY